LPQVNGNFDNPSRLTGPTAQFWLNLPAAPDIPPDLAKVLKDDMAKGKDYILAQLADNPHRRLVQDTVAEMGWWACFREERGGAPYHPSEKSPEFEPDLEDAPITYVREGPKIGRNQHCPCGSGKKFKKCCGG